MKRRDFLIASAGAAGALVPVVGNGQSKPCTPTPVSAVGGTTSVTACTSANATADWLARSTGLGVIWAHDFQNDGELNLFLRAGDPATTNPSPLPAAMPTLVATPFGSSRAMSSVGLGTRIMVATPVAAAKGQRDTWQVDDLSTWPNPATVGNYTVYIGDGAESSILEQVTVVAINAAATPYPTLDVLRAQYGSYGVGSSWPVGYAAGTGPPGNWVRPFAAFRKGDNGKPTDDIGITSGLVAARTWSTTQNSSAHLNFLEGYYGHRSYWDPAAGPAQYKNWTALWPSAGGTRVNAWDGDECYIQFRAKASLSRILSGVRKMLFVQNATSSGPGQLFWGIGKQTGVEQMPENEKVAGVTYGHELFPQVCYGDSRAPAGGILATIQTSSPDYGGTVQDGYPQSIYASTGSSFRAWCFPAEKWVTYLMHFKLGKDNAPPDTTGNAKEPTAPFASASDASYVSQFELFVCDEADFAYKTIVSHKPNFTWFFGDSGNYGYYYYNPPALNALWLGQNLNTYSPSAGGDVSPPLKTHTVQFTQVIFSKNFIPAPLA